MDQAVERAGLALERSPERPVFGWKPFLVRLYNRLNDDRVLVIAGGITFYSLLAFIPAIAAFVSIYGMFADPNSVAKLVQKMHSVLPGGAIEVIHSEIARLARMDSTSLGIATVVSLAISLWSANAGVKALFEGLNVAYREPERRSYVSLTLISLAVTMCLIAFAVVSLAAIVALPYLEDRFGGFGSVIVALCKWPALLILVTLFFAALYHFGPSREDRHWKWLTWGSTIASVLWLAASLLFSWYAANFGTFDRTYGSLGAVVGFMTWMWISTIVFMLGGIVNAELELRESAGEPDATSRP